MGTPAVRFKAHLSAMGILAAPAIPPSLRARGTNAHSGRRPRPMPGGRRRATSTSAPPTMTIAAAATVIQFNGRKNRSRREGERVFLLSQLIPLPGSAECCLALLAFASMQ